MKNKNRSVYNEEKEFNYVPPKTEDPEFKKLVESHEKLKENYSRLDTNMRSIYNDNKTLRKHVISQDRNINLLNEEITGTKSEVRYLRQLIEAMLKEDEQRF